MLYCITNILTSISKPWNVETSLKRFPAVYG